MILSISEKAITFSFPNSHLYLIFLFSIVYLYVHVCIADMTEKTSHTTQNRYKSGLLSATTIVMIRNPKNTNTVTMDPPL